MKGAFTFGGACARHLQRAEPRQSERGSTAAADDLRMRGAVAWIFVSGCHAASRGSGLVGLSPRLVHVIGAARIEEAHEPEQDRERRVDLLGEFAGLHDDEAGAR